MSDTRRHDAGLPVESGSVESEEKRVRGLKRAVKRAHGKWTAHNLHLGAGVYTVSGAWRGPHPRVERVVQTVADIAGADFSALRILDLACLEGLLAIECGRQGAEAVGVEIRDDSLAKARLAAELAGLARVTFLKGDVREVDATRHGLFDAVLACGIFYHLDAPELMPFLRSLHGLARRMVYLDTHVCPEPTEVYDEGGRTYFGMSMREHPDDVGESEHDRALWASHGNRHSFIPTKASLVNMLLDAGFTSVFEADAPVALHSTRDRVTLVALRGERRKPVGWPGHDMFPGNRMPEFDDRPRDTKWPYELGRANPATRPIAGPLPRLANRTPDELRDDLARIAGERAAEAAENERLRRRLDGFDAVQARRNKRLHVRLGRWLRRAVSRL